MNVLVISGTVAKVIYRSDSVVIFIVKTATKHVEQLRMKMFAKSDPDQFGQVKEGAFISLRAHLSNQKYGNAGETSYVTEGIVDEVEDLKPTTQVPSARPIPDKVEPIPGPKLPWSTQ